MEDSLTPIIESAIADSGLGEAAEPTSETTPEPVVEAAAEPVVEAKPEVEPAKPDVKPEADDEEALKALEADLVTKTPGLSKGRLSVSRHQAVLTRERNKHAEELKKVREEAEPFKARFEAAENKERWQAITLAETRPDIFFEKVLLETPAYREVIDKYIAARTATAQPVATPSTAQPDEEMPRPDKLHADDGSVGYTAEGAQKLLEWQERKIIAALEKKSEEREKVLRGELGPILAERKALEATNERRSRLLPILENARKNWAGFTEHETAMREWMAKPGNERTSISDAYAAVVVPAMQANKGAMEAEIRARLIKEMNATATKPTLVPGRLPAASATPGGARDMEEVIRESLRAARVS